MEPERIPVLDVPIKNERGRLWVSQADLVRANARPSGESFWLFQVGDTIYEAQGYQESRRRWWVEPVVRT